MENQFRGSGTYVASEELLKVTNIAIALQKPLLVKGEPGTGKTVLAQAIANALQKRLLIWNIKSTTKAQDGLYVYDVVQRRHIVHPEPWSWMDYMSTMLCSASMTARWAWETLRRLKSM